MTELPCVRVSIRWRCGTRVGEVFQQDCGQTWITGHGPQARGALLATRALGQPR